MNDSSAYRTVLYFVLGLGADPCRGIVESIFDVRELDEDLFSQAQRIAERVSQFLNPVADWWATDAATKDSVANGERLGPNYAMSQMVVNEEVAELAVLLTDSIGRRFPELNGDYVENAMLYFAMKLQAVTMTPEGIYPCRNSDRVAIRRAFNKKTACGPSLIAGIGRKYNENLAPR
jgi:hypothetical protein